MNKVFLMGYTGKDPDIRVSNSGMNIARVSLGVSRYKKDETDWFNLVAFDKKADFFRQYIPKGTKILVEGHLQTGKYEKDGQTHYTTDVIVDTVEFAGKKPENRTEEQPNERGFIDAEDDGELPFH